MRIEFFPDRSHDCPAILLCGCPSAGAKAVINAFRSLAEGEETEVALHQLTGVTPVGDIQLFARNAKGHERLQQLSSTLFHWCRNREGWLEAAELAEPMERSQ